jgi:hypothetical protein
MSYWLEFVSGLSLVIAFVCSLMILADILAGRRQPMWIMSVVWPITALYAGPFALWSYYKLGRPSAGQHQSGHHSSVRSKHFWQSVVLGTAHCGGGCTLGDILAEWFVFFVPLSLFGMTLLATWSMDFVLAFLLGIAFQYFSIKPMRDISVADGLRTAIKADALSLAAWQVGMYGWMAIAIFVIFGHEIAKTDPVFWFMMQIAMMAGFATSYPVNWWLIRKGIKEAM